MKKKYNFRKIKPEFIKNTFPLGYFFQPCTNCHNKDYTKSGVSPTQIGIHQRLKCNICPTRFNDNTIPGNNNAWVVEAMLDCLMDSGHLGPVADTIRKVAKYHNMETVHICKTTVFNTVIAVHNQLSILDEMFYHTNLSSVWEIDEAFQRKIYWKNMPFTNILAANSRFWLSSHAAECLTEHDALTAIVQAISRAGYAPLIIRCDKSTLLGSVINKYFPEIELDAKSHEEYIGQNAKIERLHGDARGKNLGKKKRFYCSSTLQIAVDLCRWHHNFIERHSSLDGLTPANVAGIRVNFQSWIDLLTYTYRMQYTWSLMHPPKNVLLF